MANRRTSKWYLAATIFVCLLLPFGTIKSAFAIKKTGSANSAGATVESQAFLGNLRGRILNNWLLPDGKNVVVLEAIVSPEGDAVEVTTSNSKADDLAIEAAKSAFEKSKPLGQLPRQYHGQCRIVLTFTTNVDPHGDSNSDLTSRIEQIEQNGREGTATKEGAINK